MHHVNKFEQAFAQFDPPADTDRLRSLTDPFFAASPPPSSDPKHIAQLYACLDVTTLNATDTDYSVGNLVSEINDAEGTIPHLSNPAAICVYPALISTVKEVLTADGVAIATVCGGFPAAQTFSEIKLMEVGMAVAAGADEIDFVLNLRAFLSGDYDTCVTELEEVRAYAPDAKLKVILETGALEEPRLIRDAAILALFSGADFLKTSTGKGIPGATPQAVAVLCAVLRQYNQKFGLRRGLKVSGGVSSVEVALRYRALIASLLGEEWIDPATLRIGSSSLARTLRRAMAQPEP